MDSKTTYNRKAWLDDHRIAAVVLMRLKVELNRLNKMRRQLQDIHMSLAMDDSLAPPLLQSIGILNDRIERLIEEIESKESLTSA